MDGRRESNTEPRRLSGSVTQQLFFGMPDLFENIRSQLAPPSPRKPSSPTQILKEPLFLPTLLEMPSPNKKTQSLDGLLKGRDVRIKNGSTVGVKLEVGAGDFSTDRKVPGFYQKHGGDVITEFVKGDSKTPWGARQEIFSQSLVERGAHVFTGVDATKIPEAMGSLFGKIPPPLRKLKIENPAVTHEQREKGDTTGFSYSDIFASANKALAKGGVVEWGLTGPLHVSFQSKNMGPVFEQAKAQGFELVERRTKIAKSHTFSQQVEGMKNLNLTQYVFARSSEAKEVRKYVVGRMQSKGKITNGTVVYGEKGQKTRTFVP